MAAPRISAETIEALVEKIHELNIESGKLEFVTKDLLEKSPIGDGTIKAAVTKMLQSGTLTKVGQLKQKGAPSIMVLTAELEKATEPTPITEEDNVSRKNGAKAVIEKPLVITADEARKAESMTMGKQHAPVIRAVDEKPNKVTSAPVTNEFRSVMGMWEIETLPQYFRALEGQIAVMATKLRDAQEHTKNHDGQFEKLMLEMGKIYANAQSIDKFLKTEYDAFTGKLKIEEKVTASEERVRKLIVALDKNLTISETNNVAIAKDHNDLVDRYNEFVETTLTALDGIREDLNKLASTGNLPSIMEPKAPTDNALEKAFERGFASGYQSGFSDGIQKNGISVINLG